MLTGLVCPMALWQFCESVCVSVCVCVCVYVSLRLAVFLSLAILTCLSDHLLLSLFSPQLFVNAWWQNHGRSTKKKTQSTGALVIRTCTHAHTHTLHTHWRMAAIRWGNQACEDRGALRGCNRCTERVCARAVHVCVCLEGFLSF